MMENEAREWIASRWDRASVDRLALFGDMVVRENEMQNLIAPSTVQELWSRHLLDSAQLVPLAPKAARRWIDVGTGAGFPGVIIAILSPLTETHLVEPRRRRVEFLRAAVHALQLPNVTIEQKRVEAVEPAAFDVISARAVAQSEELIRLTGHLRYPATRYILPRGRSGREEVESLRAQWQGLFHVEQSLTDPESTIIVADGVA